MQQKLTHSISKSIAQYSATIASSLSGWRKWVMVAVTAIAGALAWLTQGEDSATENTISPCAHPDTQVPAP